MEKHQRIGLSLLIFGAAAWIEFETDFIEAMSMVLMFLGNVIFLADELWRFKCD